MAASMLQRCVRLARGSVKCSTHMFTARRCLLSPAYLDASIWEQREKDPQNLAELALLMDRTYERKLPVSSLTISRFVDNISSKEEVEQAEYYLYKFRHSPNCWYLRDWTIHSWVRQCLKYGARDKALHTLKNKVQYGMFPDDTTFNLLIDSFLKEEDYKGACAVVEEVMLQEAFDLPSTQISSLYAVTKHLATKPELGWREERSLGATLLIAGLKQENSVALSAQLLGCALLGKVEMSRGIRDVYHEMPLIWTPGYLNRALNVMEKVCSGATDVKLSKEVLDCLEGVLQGLSSAPEAGADEGEEAAPDAKTDETVREEDQLERARLPEYASRFQDLSSKLRSLDGVEPSSLHALVSALAEQELGAAERADTERYTGKVQEWEEERQHLVQREKESREKALQERLARQAARAAS
ncbi:28S ribosomal protein S27, mitochondrial [Megalops cyprinoides]|uniref:28S ribosomal protein S27, mitochondrial n=1 Tax=Megalops cyprinoides TaxID=118141 RepID=UPI0018643AE8|nr:28S ribosomal protein S27, mitochondrial [Megalops cyprinoides]